MARTLDQKLKQQPRAGQAPAELATNVEIEAKIATFKQQNPNYVEYLKNLPRERLENIAVLRRVEQNEQKERIRNATAVKLEKWLEQRPEIAQQIAEKVAKISPDKQAGARINMIRTAIQTEGLKQSAPGPKVGV